MDVLTLSTLGLVLVGLATVVVNALAVRATQRAAESTERAAVAAAEQARAVTPTLEEMDRQRRRSETPILVRERRSGAAWAVTNAGAGTALNVFVVERISGRGDARVVRVTSVRPGETRQGAFHHQPHAVHPAVTRQAWRGVTICQDVAGRAYRFVDDGVGAEVLEPQVAQERASNWASIFDLDNVPTHLGIKPGDEDTDPFVPSL